MGAAKNYQAELVGVFGYPVAENPTIIMQEAGFKAAGLNYRYLNIEVRPEDLGTAMQGLRAFNMRGINLTIPHKVEVLKYLDSLSEAAQLMGAVNTVTRQGNQLIGENTDGKGFLSALTLDGHTDPQGKHIVVLGAGGAARAITVELALAGVHEITIVNRNLEHGKRLTDLLNQRTRVKTNFIPWTNPYSLPKTTDIVVNATSIGLYPDTAHKPNINYDSIQPGMLVCDVIPNPPHTIFLQEAVKHGARVLDGLSMLVYQGAIAFKLWTGMEAPIEVMISALQREFGSDGNLQEELTVP